MPIISIVGPDGAHPLHYLLGALALFLGIFSYWIHASLKTKSLAVRDALIKKLTRCG